MIKRKFVYKKLILSIILFTFVITLLMACGGGDGDGNGSPLSAVGVWLTTGDGGNKLQRQDNINFINGTGSNSSQIKVDENTKYQQMDGFGAALTDSSAWLIYNKLSTEQRNTLMKKLFSSNDGIGISYLRLPMGASDFVVSNHYTYDDMPDGETDYNLEHFSIAHDQDYIIPILKHAKNINPQLKIMGSPWSAPAWMKSPETLYGGSLRSDSCQAYANYFVKFIQAYQREGIPIHAVTVQNEPHFTNSSYPTMLMEWDEQADFIKKFLGPAFKGINTKILIWDHNWCEEDGKETNYPLNVLDDPDARDYIAGSAWHCYKGDTSDIQKKVHDIYSDKDVYFTECSGSLECEDGKCKPGRNFGDVLVWNFQKLFIGAVRNLAKTVVLWNIALDKDQGPHVGGCGICLGVVRINKDNGVVEEYEAEYYIIGHLSEFVAPGAYRIASDSYDNQIETVAFLNPDGSKILVALNPSTTLITFDVQLEGQHFSYNLPAQSVTTFKWGVNIEAPHKEDEGLIYQNFEGSGELGWAGDGSTVRCSISGEPVHSGSYSWRIDSAVLFNYNFVRSKDGSWDVDFIQENNDRLVFWIYSLPAGSGEETDNTVAVKFYDTDAYNVNGYEIWTRYNANNGQWTKLTILFTQLPSDFNLRHVDKLEFKNYYPGTYYLDDIQAENEDN
jgi:glucosylceramidase